MNSRDLVPTKERPDPNHGIDPRHGIRDMTGAGMD